MLKHFFPNTKKSQSKPTPDLNFELRSNTASTYIEELNVQEYLAVAGGPQVRNDPEA